MNENRISRRIVGRHHMRSLKTFILYGGVVVFGVGEAQAATQPALDLICNSQNGQSFHFRLDLQNRKWCFEECQSVWSIDELADAAIKLTLRTKDNSDFWTISIDRYTSDFWIVRRGYGSKPKEWGRCEAEGFSGFPQKKF